MPLTPSPEDHKWLDFTQQRVLIMRWEQECDDPSLGPPLERAIMLGNPSEDDGTGTGRPRNDIELVAVDELRELIDSLQNLEPWLMQLGDGHEPCNWIVTTVDASANTRTYGPFIKEAADAWAETQWRTIDTIVTVIVDQLERPPLV